MSQGPSRLPWPQVDYAAFGEIEVRPLSRYQRIGGQFLARNWAVIPHVTHHEEADITGLDEHKRALARANPRAKLTPLIYMIKAAVSALKAYPNFNASLADDGAHLILKKYYHIGIAVDTDDGLLVPVLRDCDKKSLVQLAREVIGISIKARQKGLTMAESSGATFTISSLGSIGGTLFTPIINAPEVAIMGISRAYRKPFESPQGVVWRTMLPLSLSYDHRVVNGADAARFCVHFAKALADPASLVD